MYILTKIPAQGPPDFVAHCSSQVALGALEDGFPTLYPNLNLSDRDYFTLFLLPFLPMHGMDKSMYFMNDLKMLYDAINLTFNICKQDGKKLRLIFC